MNKVQKIAVGVVLAAAAVQSVASMRLLKHVEAVEARNKQLREYGLHLINMLERNDVVPDEFDLLVFEYFHSEGTTKKKDNDSR